MKQIVFGLIIAFSFSNNSWADGMPEKIVVMGQDLRLKFQEGDAKKGFIAEYIPQNETWDNWRLLYAVRFTPNKNIDLISIGQEVMKNIAKKKKEGDPIANGRIFRNIKESSIGVDFLISSLGTPEKELFYEHNVFIYSNTPKGIVSYQIARRVYDKVDSPNATKKFIIDIPSSVNQMITELSSPPAKPNFNIE